VDNGSYYSTAWINDSAGPEAVIDEKEIDALRHTEYNSDPVVMEMLDTLSKALAVVKASKAVIDGTEGHIVDSAEYTRLYNRMKDTLTPFGEEERKA
jgi:hypothetical protein